MIVFDVLAAKRGSSSFVVKLALASLAASNDSSSYVFYQISVKSNLLVLGGQHVGIAL